MNAAVRRPSALLALFAAALTASGVLLAEPGGVAAVELPPGDALIEGGRSGVEVAGRRFGPDFAIELGRVRPSRAARLELPADASSRAWELRLGGFSSATVCAAGSS